MFITLFNAYFDSTTGWLLYLMCSFLMQYMIVGYSLFYYLLLASFVVMLCSIAALQMNNSVVQETFLQWTRNAKKSITKQVGSHIMLLQIDTLNWKTKVAPQCLLCSCSGWRKGISRDKVTSSSEENQTCTPFHCWVMLGWGISQLLS